MDTHALKLFMEVMRRRSFTDVANSHGVAPSSVSRTVANLEKELGFRLFQRSTRKLEPTEAGIVYYERISPLVDELESAKQIAIDINDEPKGTLRVSAPIVFGQRYIVPLLAELMEKYPLLSIELQLTDAFQDLIEERIDVAVRLGKLEDSSCIARRVKPMAFFICASPGYIKQYGKPDTPQLIQNHHCLLFPRTGYNLNWLFKSRDQSPVEIPISGHYLITNSEAIRQCAVNGMGLALLPDWLINDDIQSGTLVRLFDQYDVTATDYESAIWLLHPSREYMPLKTRLFLDDIYQHIHQIT